eukprot:jgi/Mesen1/10513/ME000083S10021
MAIHSIKSSTRAWGLRGHFKVFLPFSLLAVFYLCCPLTARAQTDALPSESSEADAVEKESLSVSTAFKYDETATCSSDHRMTWGECSAQIWQEQDADRAGPPSALSGNDCLHKSPRHLRPELLAKVAEGLGLAPEQRVLSIAHFNGGGCPATCKDFAPLPNQDAPALLDRLRRPEPNLQEAPLAAAESEESNSTSTITFVVAYRGRIPSVLRFLHSLGDLVRHFGDRCVRVALVEFVASPDAPDGPAEEAQRQPPASPATFTCVLQQFALEHGLEAQLLRLWLPGGSFSRGLGLHVGCKLAAAPPHLHPAEAAGLGEAPHGSAGICFFMDADIVLLNPDHESPSMAPVVAAARGAALKLDPDSMYAYGMGVTRVTPVRSLLALTRASVRPLRTFFAPAKFKFFKGAPPILLPGVTGHWRPKDFGILAVAYADLVRVGGYPLRQRTVWGHEDIALKMVLSGQPLRWYDDLRALNASHPPAARRASTPSGTLEMQRYEVGEIWHPWHPRVAWEASGDGVRVTSD